MSDPTTLAAPTSEAALGEAALGEASPAPAAHPLWTGGLLALSAEAQARAREAPGGWRIWMLEGGELVGCKAPREGGPLFMVLVATPEQLAAPAWARRHQELVKYLGLVGWAVERVRTRLGEGWRFTEPAPLVDPPRLPRRLAQATQQQLPLDPTRAAQHERAREATGG